MLFLDVWVDIALWLAYAGMIQILVNNHAPCVLEIPPGN